MAESENNAWTKKGRGQGGGARGGYTAPEMIRRAQEGGSGGQMS